jgi:hypothetical protein
MTHYNPGNLLKFNVHSVFQRHKQPGQDRHPFGLKCLANRPIAFQLFVASGGAVVTWKLVNPSDETGATFTAMTAGDLDIVEKDGGGIWITWPGVADLTTSVACGFWEVWVTVDGTTTYYSEVIHLRESTEPEPIWRMRFSQDTDKGNVLYQNGYQQYFYPTKFAWDRPAVERDLEISVDGNGNETTRFSRTTYTFRLEVSDIPDYAIHFFSRCGDLSDIIFEDTVEGYSITMSNVTFEFRVQGIGLNIGVFKFTADIEAFNGCQENFILA